MNTKNGEIITTKIKTDVIYNFRKNVEEITIQDDTEHIQRHNCQGLLPNNWIVSGTCSDISGYLDFEIAIIPNERKKYDWLNIESIDIYNVDMGIIATNPRYGNTSVRFCSIKDIDAFFELAKSLPDPDTFQEWKKNYQKINKAIWDIKIKINTSNYKE